MTFEESIKQGIPDKLPEIRPYRNGANSAPKRKDILTKEEKKLALRNALRYFPAQWHKELANEFSDELKEYGRIYMYRFKPDYKMYARPIEEYPTKSLKAAGIMLMIQNNLDPAVAQHPEELITYGGNGAVFQNWAQYLLTMQYLSEMTEKQTLHMYSGHPMGLFPSSEDAPRVIVTNGMVIPNYSQPDHLEKFNALGVSQYGQMTAGSYMYIGPQGIVHGTTITVMNAFRKMLPKGEAPAGKIFLTAGLGGMSGAQPKAGNIAGCITICAEVNPQAAKKRHDQGWVDELIDDIDTLIKRTRIAKDNEEVVSIAYIGNVVEIWERFDEENLFIHVGSDQTSLHNPWSGGYYPVDMSYDDANTLLRENPSEFKSRVQNTLIRHAAAINSHTVDFKYPSYVQDILGPMCFDFGFGPFRWVCASGKSEDLDKTDAIAADVLQTIMENSPEEIQLQMQDNITWIKNAKANKLVVGSQARILYADAEGRMKIAKAFNDAIAKGDIGPVVLGRDHHDVSGTDSPFRETSNIYDGSKYTADMAIHNVIGDSFRGATWVSIHNGGGVGWGEVINGGFGLLLDGSKEAEAKLKNMLFYDVNNGIARRSWARNKEAIFAIKREMDRTPELKVTLPNIVDDEVIDGV